MQRYFAKILNENIFVLDENDKHHIINVMRMKDNDLIEIVYENNLYIGKININPFTVIKVEEISNDTKKIPFITLIIPFLKEQKVDYILQKATELGVNEIIFTQTERSIVKIDEKNKSKKLERWIRICKEASEQSKRLDIPKLTIIDNIQKLEKSNNLLVVCSTKEKSVNIKTLLKDNKNMDITFMIGSEGGLTSFEENKLNKLGFISATLGNNIMRVETVPLFLMSVVNYEYME